MSKYAREFILRGLVASGFGPLVLIVLYLMLYHQRVMVTLTVQEVCLGIVSLYLLAFLAGGMNVIYQNEKLPLMWAILIHGGVLYAGYLAVYLVNGWLQSGLAPILAFTVIFALGYLGIWAVINFITRQNTRKVNKLLKQKQLAEESRQHVPEQRS